MLLWLLLEHLASLTPKCKALFSGGDSVYYIIPIAVIFVVPEAGIVQGRFYLCEHKKVRNFLRLSGQDLPQAWCHSEQL